jgi:hypothetical protein
MDLQGHILWGQADEYFDLPRNFISLCLWRMCPGCVRRPWEVYSQSSYRLAGRFPQRWGLWSCWGGTDVELSLLKATCLGWGVTRWWSACLACMKPWVWSPGKTNEKLHNYRVPLRPQLRQVHALRSCFVWAWFPYFVLFLFFRL